MNGDIRQILGFLQIWKKRNQRFIYSTFEQNSAAFKKDTAVTVSNFDAATILLNKDQRKKLDLRELLDLFFIDYDMIPLLVQENYLNAASRNSSSEDLKNICKAANSIAKSD